MAQRMSGNPWVDGARSLGAALFPDARSEAAGRMAGQQLSKLTADTQLAQAKAFSEQDQNSALEDAVLRAAGFDDRTRALIRAGRGNAAQLADAYETTNRINADAAAGDAFGDGNYDGASAARLRGGRDPLQTNQIDEGYQLNPYDTGGEITATGETLADIAVRAAQARQADAAAEYSRERARNPERFRAPPRAPAAQKPVTISPAETKALADEAARFLPKEAQTQENIMAVVARASEMVIGGMPPAQALQQSFTDLFESVPEATTGDDDWIPFNESTTPATVRRRKQAPAPVSAKQTAAQPGPDMAAAEGIRAAFRAGRITREQARAELLKLGFN